MRRNAKNPAPKKTTELGELVALLHRRFYARYRDEALADIATAAVVQDLLAARRPRAAACDKAA